MSKLVIPDDVAAQMEQHAIEIYPDECCGLIVGWRRKNDIECKSIHPSRNVSDGDKHRSFEIDPKLRFDLMRECDATSDGMEIVGHYHSHPDGEAKPSATDLKMAYETEFIWLICAVTKNGQTALSAHKPRRNRDEFDEWSIERV